MRSKLTKTIFTIVFVVFLGLIKAETVKAEDYFAQCYYSDGEVDAVVGIQYNFSFAEIVYRSDMSTNKYKSILNWSPTSYSAKYIDYNGYDDSWNNNKCPDYLLLEEDNTVYFSDAEHADEIMGWVKVNLPGSYTWHKMSLVGHTYQDADASTHVSYMKCECKSEAQLQNVSYYIAKDRRLTLPNIFGNSATRDKGYWYSYGLPYVVANNTCPERLFKSGDSYYFSSAADAETVKSLISGSGSVTELTCQVSSDTPTPERVQKPEYNPPTVNEGIVNPLNSNSATFSCGNGYMTDIPSGIIRVVNIFYIILQILVPIALVILGSLDLAKAIAAQKEDEIKKGQQIFVKRLIAAIIIFFVFIVVKLVVGIFSNDDNEIIDCMNCFLQGTDNCD